ncbi:hypothetical protein D3C71_1770660 [compost metagenome]
MDISPFFNEEPNYFKPSFCSSMYESIIILPMQARTCLQKELNNFQLPVLGSTSQRTIYIVIANMNVSTFLHEILNNF